MTYTYIRRIPSPPLNAYIGYLYYLEGALYPRERILPFPSLDLKINFGGVLRVIEPHGAERAQTLTESWWTGVWSAYHTIDWPDDLRFYGVYFRPAGVYPFLQLPLSELHNRVVPLEGIWGGYAAEIRERLHVAGSVQAGLALLERLLLARLCDAPYGFDLVRYAVQSIHQRHGALSIRGLSDHVGISQNHLLTYFKRMVGVGPKELARLVRLRHVFRLIDPTQPVDWAQIAHQCGYYDQAHLSNDFRMLLGLSPTGYLRRRRELHAANPDRDRLLRVLPIE